MAVTGSKSPSNRASLGMGSMGCGRGGPCGDRLGLEPVHADAARLPPDRGAERPGTLEAMFGVYAVGLIPGLLIGGRYRTGVGAGPS